MFDPVWFSSFVKDIPVFWGKEKKKKRQTITREAGQRCIKKQTNKNLKNLQHKLLYFCCSSYLTCTVTLVWLILMVVVHLRKLNKVHLYKVVWCVMQLQWIPNTGMCLGQKNWNSVCRSGTAAIPRTGRLCQTEPIHLLFHPLLTSLSVGLQATNFLFPSHQLFKGHC